MGWRGTPDRAVYLCCPRVCCGRGGPHGHSLQPPCSRVWGWAASQQVRVCGDQWESCSRRPRWVPLSGLPHPRMSWGRGGGAALRLSWCWPPLPHLQSAPPSWIRWRLLWPTRTCPWTWWTSASCASRKSGWSKQALLRLLESCFPGRAGVPTPQHSAEENQKRAEAVALGWCSRGEVTSPPPVQPVGWPWAGDSAPGPQAALCSPRKQLFLIVN